MKLGTIVFEGKIYNLDYMEIDEMKSLLKKIEEDKISKFKDMKELLNNR